MRSCLITLLTDFGRTDTYVGQMHAVIAGIAPQARVIDLTHDVAPQDVALGAILLADAVGATPPGTVHMAVVDPGVGSDRRAIAANIGDWTFVAPDNGLLSMVLDRWPLHTAVELTNHKYFRADVSATFHGRDVFSPVAAHLATGIPLRDLGAPVASPLVRLQRPIPEVTSAGIRGEVLSVDHFGNLITNVRGEHLAAGRNAAVRIGDRPPIPLVRCYADVAPGSELALIGSSQHLEISVRNGSACQRLGSARGTPVMITFS